MCGFTAAGSKNFPERYKEEELDTWFLIFNVHEHDTIIKMTYFNKKNCTEKFYSLITNIVLNWISVSQRFDFLVFVRFVELKFCTVAFFPQLNDPFTAVVHI